MRRSVHEVWSMETNGSTDHMLHLAHPTAAASSRQ